MNNYEQNIMNNIDEQNIMYESDVHNPITFEKNHVITDIPKYIIDSIYDSILLTKIDPILITPVQINDDYKSVSIGIMIYDENRNKDKDKYKITIEKLK